MESVLESGVRRTCTTAARGGASADTDGLEPPKRPHPVADTKQAAVSPSAINSVPIKDDRFCISWLSGSELKHARRHRRDPAYCAAPYTSRISGPVYPEASGSRKFVHATKPITTIHAFFIVSSSRAAKSPGK